MTATSALLPARGPETTVLRMPVEDPRPRWWRATGATLGLLVRHPSRLFQTCREPIPHARVLLFLIGLRFPLWGVLLAGLVGQAVSQTIPVPIDTKPVHQWIDAPLAEVASHWLVFMVPVGVPLLYFVAGLLAHIGLALTGGATRSIGASMRACGYALAPALLIIGVADLPLYLGGLGGLPYLILLAIAGAWTWLQAGMALGSTHRISAVRGFLVAALPVGFLLAVTAMRAFLVLPDVPGIPVGSVSPYYVP